MKNMHLPQNWTRTHLKDVARDFLNGGTPSTKEPRYWDGDIPWTTSAPIEEDDLYLDRGQRFITREGLENSASNLVPKGNLLVATRVGVGKAVVNLVDIAISQDLTGVVLDPDKACSEFVAFQLKASDKQSYFERHKRGATIKGVTREDLETLEIDLPPIAEQRAVAQALRAIQCAKWSRLREATLLDEFFRAMLEELMTGRLSAVPLTEEGGKR